MESDRPKKLRLSAKTWWRGEMASRGVATMKQSHSRRRPAKMRTLLPLRLWTFSIAVFFSQSSRRRGSNQGKSEVGGDGHGSLLRSPAVFDDGVEKKEPIGLDAGEPMGLLMGLDVAHWPMSLLNVEL